MSPLLSVCKKRAKCQIKQSPVVTLPPAPSRLEASGGTWALGSGTGPPAGPGHRLPAPACWKEGNMPVSD